MMGDAQSWRQVGLSLVATNLAFVELNFTLRQSRLRQKLCKQVNNAARVLFETLEACTV